MDGLFKNTLRCQTVDMIIIIADKTFIVLRMLSLALATLEAEA